MSSSPAQGYNVNETEVTTVRKLETIIGSRTGAIGSEEEAFAVDLTPTTTEPGQQTIFSIFICYGKSTRMEVTFDSGANWCVLNEDTDIIEDNLYLFLFPVADGDGFNIRFKDDSDITVLRVGETI